jgi:hypothetical protein
MAEKWWAEFLGTNGSFDELLRLFPTVQRRDCDGHTYLVGSPLKLGPDPEHWREEAETFADTANRSLVLSNPFAAPIKVANTVRCEGKAGVETRSLPERPKSDSITHPVVLRARMDTRKGTVRPLPEREAQLSARDPKFASAVRILAMAGTDLRELYRAAEAIENAHGGFPPIKKPTQRSAFCHMIEVSEDDWAALHRSARPARHALPHDMSGPTITATQARVLIQHALKLWLEREVPQ